MGACLLHGPMSVAIRSGEMGRTTVGKGGSAPGTYSFGEMIQLLDFLENKMDIPAEFRPICGYHVPYQPGPGAPGFTGADVCLMEPNGVVDIDWDGLKINRAQVQRYITNPLKTLGRDTAKMANNWYQRGILACNEEVRAELAAELIRQVPDNLEGRDLMIGVLDRAHGVKRDAEADLEEIVGRVPIPIGVLAYAYQYLPDGRPMFWPADFNQTIKSVVSRFDLPFLEPWRLVLEHGGEPVLKPDLRHYREEFIPTVATFISRFASEVAGQGKLAA